MTVGSCATNDVVALLRCEEITQPRAEITTATLQGEQERMILQTTCYARDHVRTC